MKAIISAFILALNLGYTVAECPNACSSHGRCGAFDMCICFRNWMANDCSERVCPFGLAHVDTPKGDLDSSGGALSGPDTVVAENSEVYPYGTTELFPAASDSRGSVLANTAHYYMECSNKGICDRTSATCNCFPGYEGSACQRASCPSSAEGVCSGHGTCQTIQEIAALDYGNIYELWDKDSTLACYCDPGYYGPDCSKRECKHGYDPLYNDDYSTVRYSNWTYVIYTTTQTTVYGNYSIVFYDVFGEDWQTDPIQINATCTDVISALESLPNEVIKSGSVTCASDTATYTHDNSADTIYDASIYLKARFTITFPQNPGKLRQIGLNTYLDGDRPTLFTAESDASTLGSFIYANGFTGEEVDYVPDYCDGVTVSLVSGDDTKGDYLTGLSTQTTKLLKKCLGDADGNTAQSGMANEVYNWDYGNHENPHLVKLIDTTGNIPGFYVALYFDGTYFRLLNPVYDTYPTSTFYVYTTTGTLQVVSDHVSGFSVVAGSPVSTRISHFHSNVIYTTNSTTRYSGNTGAIDCETMGSDTSNATISHLFTCLNKNDLVVLINPHDKTYNPTYLNIYELKKISRESRPSTFSELTRHQLVLDTGVNGYYSHIAQSDYGDKSQKSSYARVYKFTPPTGVTYAAECSGRGICDETTGTCNCFTGYTNDDCSVQNVLAK